MSRGALRQSQEDRTVEFCAHLVAYRVHRQCSYNAQNAFLLRDRRFSNAIRASMALLHLDTTSR
jgi:hypothetical protein